MSHVGVRSKGPRLVRESQVGFRKVPLSWFGPKLVLASKRVLLCPVKLIAYVSLYVEGRTVSLCFDVLIIS